MYTPKSRAIYLEPVTRRGKVKKVKASSSVGTQDNSTGQTLSRESTPRTHTTRSSPPLQNPPLSPAPSEETVETRESASTHSFHVVEQHLSQQKKSDNSEPRSSTTSNSVQTISATTEITRHGALPGDTVPVRVKVEHTKATRGVVIATLYRQGRIDMLPPLRVVSRSKDKKPEYEDVYPKSRTGLGGLYFTKGNPNMAFRKDLTQTSTMMIVDPRTKTADVKFSIRVPNEAFPTMNNIPGGMISFTYHIEVVIDLTGKLGETRLLPSLTTNGPSFTSSVEAPPNQLTTDWASNILDTAPLRRTKNVAAFELPLTIGTEDSNRSKRLEEIRQDRRDDSFHGKQPAPQGEDHGDGQYWQENGYFEHDNHHDHYRCYGYDGEWHDDQGHPYNHGWHEQYNAHYPPPTNGHQQQGVNGHFHVPPPQEDDHLDEKSRLHRQEQLLLPSRPPEAEGSSSQPRALAPSAPILDNDLSHCPSSPQSSIPITISRASARSAETIVPDPLTPPPSLPEDSGPLPGEDKQELERRRLLAQVSAPPTDDGNHTGPSNTPCSAPPASAPVIDDEEYLSQALRQEGNENLPQYHR